jgi:hypothetical protein
MKYGIAIIKPLQGSIDNLIHAWFTPETIEERRANLREETADEHQDQGRQNEIRVSENDNRRGNGQPKAEIHYRSTKASVSFDEGMVGVLLHALLHFAYYEAGVLTPKSK